MWIRDYKLTQEREKELRYRMNNMANEEALRRPVDPVLERLNRFERTLSEISTKFESSLQFPQPKTEEKNPFLNFQLDKEDLRSAFQVNFD